MGEITRSFEDVYRIQTRELVKLEAKVKSMEPVVKAAIEWKEVYEWPKLTDALEVFLRRSGENK